MATYESKDEEHLHPAHAEGKIAFGNGISLDNCPYDWNTDEFHAWRQGWQEALSAEFT